MVNKNQKVNSAFRYLNSDDGPRDEERAKDEEDEEEEEEEELTEDSKISWKPDIMGADRSFSREKKPFSRRRDSGGSEGGEGGRGGECAEGESAKRREKSSRDVDESTMEFPGWISTVVIMGHSLGEMIIPVIVGNFMSTSGGGGGGPNYLPLTLVATASAAFFLFYLLWFVTARSVKLFLMRKESCTEPL